MHAKDTRAAEGIKKERERKGNGKKAAPCLQRDQNNSKVKYTMKGPLIWPASQMRGGCSLSDMLQREREREKETESKKKKPSQKFEIFRPYECIHGTLYMHYKCQINTRLSRNDIPSIWIDPQRDEKHPKWKVNALDSVHYSPNKDIASRPDNMNEFRSHSEARFLKRHPGIFAIECFFHTPTERAVILSLREKQKSLSHFIGHHRDQYRRR